MKKMMRIQIFFLLLLATVFPLGHLSAQGGGIRPATVWRQMPDFTLTAVEGGDFGIAELKGKNILLIFPRGRVEDHWCQICHYQYAELVELEKELGLRKKYNLEILFVLPYDKATVERWVSLFPEQMTTIEGWKNPPNPEKLDETAKKRLEMIRKLFPRKIDIKEGNIPTPFPILIDGDRAVSKGLGLFTTDWDQSKVEQNIPAVYIIDATGMLQFKYISQNTIDRPEYEYLIRFLDRMIMGH